MNHHKNHEHHSDDHEHHDHGPQSHQGHMSSSSAQDFLKRFFIVTGLLIPLAIISHPVVSILSLENLPYREFLQFGLSTIIFYFSLVFFQHAQHEIQAKQYGMMTLVSLAVGAGFGFSAIATFLPQLEGEFYLEISTLIWILLFGHYLEAKSSSAAGDALQEVAKLLPKEAHLLADGSEKDVPLTELKEGNTVIVKPGEKVPADGKIVKGSSNMNEALISGESKPIKKGVGSSVVAGSICIDGSIHVQLSRVGENSTIGQIQKLISQAQKTKPSAQQLADKAARVLTFSALASAIIAISVWSGLLGKPFVFSFTLAITALVIACPHALGLAIPTVSTIATTLAVKNGVFLKDLGKIEVVKNIDWVVFDKTGTLTKGEFGVTDVVSISSSIQQDILKIAASLESSSSHVIGVSIVKHAKDNKVRLDDVNAFTNFAGKGIQGTIDNKQYLIGNKKLLQEKKLMTQKTESEYAKLSGEGKTVIFIANSSEVIGLVALADEIKKESNNAVRRLHELGIKIAMLTGDNEQVAKTVSRKLNIDTFFANVLPEDKYKHIRDLQSKGYKVMMVGDGVNDAPALTQADVGVAIGAGTDVAVEAGDIVLTRNNPEDIVRLINLSKKVYRKMFENLLWATGYNVLAIPAAIGAFAPWGFFLKPQIGALLMASSSIIVVVNALTLKRIKL